MDMETVPYMFLCTFYIFAHNIVIKIYFDIYDNFET